MDLISRISENFSESAHLKLQSMDALAGPIATAAEHMVQCFKHDGKILACGNGGSAADAQHLAAEFVSKLARDRDPLAAKALTVDSSILTAICNDYGYDEIFARQVSDKMRANDVFLGITTSGKSPKISSRRCGAAGMWA